MLQRAFHIAVHYWRTTFLNRNVLVFALLMPLVFTFVLGTVLGQDNAQIEGVAVLVVDEDGTTAAGNLTALLRANPLLTVQVARQEDASRQVSAGDASASLLIPSGFETAVMAGQPAGVDLTLSPGEARETQVVEQELRGVVAAFNSRVQAASIAGSAFEQLNGAGVNVPDRATLLAQASEAWEAAAPVQVEDRPVTRLTDSMTIPDGFYQSSPGMLVTFALVFLLNGTLVLIVERQQGTLRRLLVMPMRKATILFGKLGGIFVAGLLQSAILIVAGAVFFEVPWGQSPVALVVMMVCFAFSITSLGMLVAGVARTYAQANALANILMYSIAALGGAWWPIEIVPSWMQQLARLTPTYWAMQGFQDIIVRGLGLAAILPSALALLVFGALYLSIGVWRFRYE